MAESSSSGDASAPSKSQRTWLGEWVREKAFWREVASRTFAGVFAALIIAALAGVVAWALSEEWRPWLSASAIFLVVLFAVGAIWVPISRAWMRHLVAPRKRWWAKGLLAVPNLIMMWGFLLGGWILGQYLAFLATGINPLVDSSPWTITL